MNILKTIRQLFEAVGSWGIFWLFHFLPFKLGSTLGAGLGRLVGPHLFLSKRARINLKRCFPNLAPAKIENIVKEMWDNFGRLTAEYSQPSFFWDGVHLKNIEIVGAENLVHIRDDGKPGIIFSGHLGNWQIITLAAQSLGLDLTQMYRSANNPWVNKLMIKAQKLAVKNIITKKDRGPRELLSLLKKGNHAFLLIDQKMGEGIPVPFLGHKAMTAQGVARLYLTQNCPLLPARCERISPYKFRVTFYPPVRFTPTGQQEEDTYNLLLSLNTLIGSWIEERPGQWLWLHRRWT